MNMPDGNFGSAGVGSGVSAQADVEHIIDNSITISIVVAIFCLPRGDLLLKNFIGFNPYICYE